MVDVPKLQPVPSKIWWLRWRFEFADGTSRIGVWNLASEHPADKAANVNKEGMIAAVIEGKNTATKEIKRFFECTRNEYIGCRGEAYTRVSRVIGLRGKIKPRENVSGITFVLEDREVTVWVNGTVKQKALTEAERERNKHIYEHRLGSDNFTR